MGVRFDERELFTGSELINDATPEEADYSIGEIFSAAFTTENTVGSLLNQETRLPNKVKSSDFNAWSEMTEDEKLDERFISAAAFSDNIEELNAFRRQVAKERKNRKILQESGALGVGAAITAGVFDPINLIPVGGTAYRTYKTGSSILRGAMATGTAAASSTALAETLLHYTQLERTYGESATNMAGALLLGGAIGGAIGGLSAKQLNKIESDIQDSMNVEPKVESGGDSVGAMRYSENLQIKGAAVRVLAKSLAFDPLTRGLTSRFQQARNITHTLAENPIDVDGKTGTSIESRVKIYDGKYYLALNDHMKSYSDMQKRLSGLTGIGRAINKKGYSRQEFNELVAKEMRNPQENALPEVKQAADVWRNNLYEPIKNELIELKLLPEDVDVSTAANYLNRMWNSEKISEKLPEFIDTVSKWLKQKDMDELARAEKLGDELAAINKEIDKLRKAGQRATPEQLARINELEEGLVKSKGIKQRDLEDVEYQDIARQIANRIQGTPDGRLPYDWKIGEGSKTQSNYGAVNKDLRGPLKSRTFDIPDELVEQFLDNDIEFLAMRYYRQLAPDIELKRTYGDVTLQETAFKDLEKEYNELSAKAKTGKERRKLKKEYDQAVNDLSGIRDRIRGLYGVNNSMWARTARAIRDLNYLRFMGGVVASSIPDVMRIFMAEGFTNTFRYGLKPLVSNLRQFKVSAAEGKRYGVGVDVLMGGRASIIADVADYTKGGTALERGLSAMSSGFGKINLMDYWTASVKQLHAVTMQNTVIQSLLSGKPNKQIASKLRRLGIDESDAKEITGLLKQTAEKVDGVWLSNAKKWPADIEAKWGSAIRKESDRVIVVPGQEKPLFMSTELGKTIMQFRSFMFSATQRVFMAGLQGQDSNFVGGLVGIMSLGMMSYAFKQWDAGRDISTDPVVLVAEGLDRSGALGMIMEINNTVEKMSGNNIGFRAVIGAAQPASRFASRSQAEALLGPTFGSLLNTTIAGINGLTDANEMTDSDVRTIRRLLPYQNVTILRQAFDKIEKQVAQEIQE